MAFLISRELAQFFVGVLICECVRGLLVKMLH